MHVSEVLMETRRECPISQNYSCSCELSGVSAGNQFLVPYKSSLCTLSHFSHPNSFIEKGTQDY